MTLEPEKIGNDTKWAMPQPIFRSSEGQDLRAALANARNSPGSEDDTEIPEITMENEPQNAANATTDLQGENAIEKESKGDKLGMSMTAVGLAALLGAGLIFLLFYFLFFRQAATGTP